MFGRVGGGELHANAGLAFGNDRKKEADHINSALQQGVRKTLGEGRVVEHDGHDGRLAVLKLESRFAQAGLESGHVVHEAVAQLGGAVQQVEHREAGPDNRWGEAVAEQVGTRALAEHFDEFLAAGGESAHGPA